MIYYADFDPPPFLETLRGREIMEWEQCWKNGCVRAGNGRVGLCSSHYEQLREEEP